MAAGRDREPQEGADRLLRHLGAAVRHWRRVRGLSRRELQAASGLSTRYLAQLEAGHANISGSCNTGNLSGSKVRCRACD